MDEITFELSPKNRRDFECKMGREDYRIIVKRNRMSNV